MKATKKMLFGADRGFGVLYRGHLAADLCRAAARRRPAEPRSIILPTTLRRRNCFWPAWKMTPAAWRLPRPTVRTTSQATSIWKPTAGKWQISSTPYTGCP